MTVRALEFVTLLLLLFLFAVTNGKHSGKKQPASQLTTFAAKNNRSSKSLMFSLRQFVPMPVHPFTQAAENLEEVPDQSALTSLTVKMKSTVMNWMSAVARQRCYP